MLRRIRQAADSTRETVNACPAASRRPGRSRSAACFIVRDGDKQALAYVYFENEPGRRSSAKLLTRDEAFLIAVNIDKLPSVPRQVLKPSRSRYYPLCLSAFRRQSR